MLTLRSTNGRRGLTISRADGEEVRAGEAIPGAAIDLGTQDGFRVIRIDPAQAGQFVAVFNSQVETVQGCTAIAGIDLQSGDYVSVVAMGPISVLTEIGYKGRTKRTSLWRDGTRQELTGPQLVALGILPPGQDAAPVAAPPPVESAFAAALKAAGL